jgi:VCBS repeat-containing protein
LVRPFSWPFFEAVMASNRWQPNAAFNLITEERQQWFGNLSCGVGSRHQNTASARRADEAPPPRAQLSLEILEDRLVPAITGLATLYHGFQTEFWGARTTHTTLRSSADPSEFSQPITLTAVVTPTIWHGLPAGKVTFEDGKRILGSSKLNAIGKATFTISTLGGGNHHLLAVYGGDTRYAGSQSPSLLQFVNADPPTTTTVSSSTNPAMYGSTVTFTAQVMPVPPATGMPTGTVTFKDGSNTLGTASLNSSAQAFYATATLSPGSHSITAIYNGDANFTTSTSSASSETVNVQTPVANNDSFSVVHDHSLTVSSPGVLGNDSANGGPGISAVLVSNTSHGSLTLNADGSFSYQPGALYAGQDSFTYKDYNGTNYSNVATATINVTNSAPIAVNDSAVADQDNPITIAVLANDYDPDGDNFSLTSVSSPTNGTATINSDGTVTYLPNQGFTGTDTFTYTITDSVGSTATATVTVAIHPLVATDHFADVSEGTPTVSGNVLTNDIGDGITVQLVNGTSPGSNVVGDFGSLFFQSSGSFTYSLNTNDPGVIGLQPGDTLTDQFTYLIQSVRGGIQAATLTVTVEGQSGSLPASATLDDGYFAPFGLDTFYSVSTGGSLSVTADNGVLANVYAVQGASLTAVLDSSPSHGSLSLNSDGSFSYIPNSGYSGQDSFSVRPSDGVQVGDPFLVNLQVVQIPAPVFSVGGAIRYDKTNPRVANPHFVRQALVEVFDQNNRVLGHAYTNDYGVYSVPLQVRPQQFRVRVYTITRPGIAAGPRRGLAYTTLLGNSLRHTFKFETDLYRPPAGPGAVLAPVTLGDTTVAAQGFWSFDAFVTAVKLHNTIPNAPVGTLFAWRFPLAVTSYTINERVRLKPTDWNGWDTIVHEYGHAVAQSLGFYPFAAAQYLMGELLVPMSHTPEENTRITHPNFSRLDDNKLAFQEGWANFYSMVAQSQDSTMPVGIVGDDGGTSGDGKLYQFTVELGRPVQSADQGAVGFSNGEDEELTVMRVLWDLYDPITSTDTNQDLGMDNVALGFNGVLSKIRTQGSVALTLSDLWNNLIAGATTQDKLNYGSETVLKAHLC